MGLVRRRELAEELVQDAFLRLHRHWDKVEQPRAWVYRAVRNLALNSLRKSQRESVEEGSDERVGESKEAPELLAADRNLLFGGDSRRGEGSTRFA